MDSLQSFKLSHPVLCIGGVIQVELLGRTQMQHMDQQYYIWSVFFLPEKAAFLVASVVILLIHERCRHRFSGLMH